MAKEDGPISLRIQSLVHLLECANQSCYFLCCHRMMTIVKHMRSCEASVSRMCYQLVCLMIYHAKHNCPKKQSREECEALCCDFLKWGISSWGNRIQLAYEKLTHGGQELRIHAGRVYWKRVALNSAFINSGIFLFNYQDAFGST
jgi:hypothetical protein